MIKQEEVKRDNNGFWTHPEFPDFGETINPEIWHKWCVDNGIKSCFVSFENDAPENLQDKWFEDGNTNCTPWEPTKPADNAFLLTLHDTEDGPVAIFAIPVEGKTA